MKRILVLAFLLATGLGHSLFAEGTDTSSARTAWSRMLKARGMEKTSIGTIAVTETSSAVPLRATYVHSDSSGWWILWDLRPTPLGAVLEVYDTKARLAAGAIADKGEFVAASPSKFGLRHDFRLQFMAIYEPNASDLNAIPKDFRSCGDKVDCLTVEVGDRKVVYRLDHKTNLPVEVTVEIPPQPQRDGIPPSAAVSMVTRLFDYKNRGGVIEPQRLERNDAVYNIKIFLDPPIRTDLFDTSFSHVPANEWAWKK